MSYLIFFRIQDILGYSASDVVGQSLYSFHHGVDNEVLTDCHKTCKYLNSCTARYFVHFVMLAIYEISYIHDFFLFPIVLTKGQCVSGYYRLLAKYGGWVWVQTKASIVYASKTCQPQFVLCIHYAIR
jgi:PAS domain-containing protein